MADIRELLEIHQRRSATFRVRRESVEAAQKSLEVERGRLNILEQHIAKAIFQAAGGFRNERSVFIETGGTLYELKAAGDRRYPENPPAFLGAFPVKLIGRREGE